MARLLSVNVGLPYDIGWLGKAIHTASEVVRRSMRAFARDIMPAIAAW